MAGVLSGWAMANLVLFVVLAAAAWRVFRRSGPGPTRSVLRGLMLVSATFAIGALQRGGLQAARSGAIDESWETFLLEEFSIVLAAIATWTGIYALYCLNGALKRLAQAERMITVLTERVPLDVAVSDWGLTARELQVLEAIVDGHTSDEQLADLLYIAPSTAGTHVRNILRKSSLNSRMDLMLVGAGQFDETGDVPPPV